MLTISDFTVEWKRLHHPSMNVDSDVAFFYEIYCRLRRLIEQDATGFDEQQFLSLLLYTENTIAIGLDGVYEYRYRSVGDVVSRWCNGLGMNANAASQVHNLVSLTVAEAPCSALRKWITDSALSGDFHCLTEMLTYFAKEDNILQLVYPDLRYRKSMFLQFVGDEMTAGQMLWSDIAFNWRDKQGHSLPDTLAKRCRLTAPLTEEPERTSLLNSAKALDTICSERLDSYNVIGQNCNNTFTLRHRDGRVFTYVTFPVTVPETIQNRHFVAQLVTYMGNTYAVGPVVGLTDIVRNVDKLWNDVLKKEQEAARQVFFTTPFGKRITLYEDLYTVAENPDDAYYADMGIYFDEPNIFDFMEALKPAAFV